LSVPESRRVWKDFEFEGKARMIDSWVAAPCLAAPINELLYKDMYCIYGFYV
jgi:hypothetical protein